MNSVEVIRLIFKKSYTNAQIYLSKIYSAVAGIYIIDSRHRYACLNSLGGAKAKKIFLLLHYPKTYSFDSVHWCFFVINSPVMFANVNQLWIIPNQLLGYFFIHVHVSYLNPNNYELRHVSDEARLVNDQVKRNLQKWLLFLYLK